jgi:hypothetical protein
VWIGGSPTGAWQVDGKARDVVVDESRRPFLAHLQLLQEWLLCGGDANAAIFGGPTTSGAERVAITKTDKNTLTLDATHHVVLCVAAVSQTITLPKCGPSNEGRVYIVKNVVAPSSALGCDPSDKIDNVSSKKLAVGNAFTVVSDGENTWHIISTVA